MKATKITTTQRDIKIPFLGEILNVTYSLAALTDDLRREVRENDRDLKGFEHGIVGCVVEWDWNDDNDKPLPITHDTLATMPYPLKQAIWLKVVEDADPKSLGAASRTGSARREQ